MSLIEKALDIISMPVCVVCGREGKALCVACQGDYQNTAISACYLCNANTTDFKTCSSCQVNTKLHSLFVVCDYEGEAAQLIKDLKFRQHRHNAKPLAEMIASRLPDLPSDTLIVPVPTSYKRKRRRGFDQAELLASILGKHINLQNVKALSRLSNSRQVGSNRKQRQENAHKMLRSVNGADIIDKDVLIIDDVVTTGATLNAAAEVLKSAGAKSIRGVVVARD